MRINEGRKLPVGSGHPCHETFILDLMNLEFEGQKGAGRVTEGCQGRAGRDRNMAVRSLVHYCEYG